MVWIINHYFICTIVLVSLSLSKTTSSIDVQAQNSVNGWMNGTRQGTFDNNEQYDPATNTWTIETPMPTARHGLGVTSIDDKIYAIGGGPNPGLRTSWENEIYDTNKMG